MQMLTYHNLSNRKDYLTTKLKNQNHELIIQKILFIIISWIIVVIYIILEVIIILIIILKTLIK